LDENPQLGITELTDWKDRIWKIWVSSDETINDIIDHLIKNELTIKEIAAKFGKTPNYVSNIKHRKITKN
jgi:AraC-like DNA-binding protein